MKELNNIEFYNTPSGEIMYKSEMEGVAKLAESDQDIIQWFLDIISERYPEAFSRLSDLYSKRSRNRMYFEFSMVRRFIRCNFGEYDEYNYDIDGRGIFHFEEVRCPLRGECPYEGIICKPVLNTKLSTREMEVFRLIAQAYDTYAIAEELSLSPSTICRHRENIKAKIKVRTVSQMILYWQEHNLK